jgi:hypothetical protein
MKLDSAASTPELSATGLDFYCFKSNHRFQRSQRLR